LNGASATFGLTSTARKLVIEKSRSEAVAVDPAGEQNAKLMNPSRWRMSALLRDYGLKAAIAGGPKSAMSGRFRTWSSASSSHLPGGVTITAACSTSLLSMKPFDGATPALTGYFL
jgi:hypothetical protein